MVIRNNDRSCFVLWIKCHTINIILQAGHLWYKKGPWNMDLSFDIGLLKKGRRSGAGWEEIHEIKTRRLWRNAYVTDANRGFFSNRRQVDIWIANIARIYYIMAVFIRPKYVAVCHLHFASLCWKRSICENLLLSTVIVCSWSPLTLLKKKRCPQQQCLHLKHTKIP